MPHRRPPRLVEDRRPRRTPSSRRRSTSRLCARRNATWSWLTKRWTSLRGSPISARPSWLRGTSLPPRPEQQLGRVVALVEVRAADRAAAVEALEVEARRAEVAQPVLLGVRAQRRAVGGDVVRDELAEERPAGRDGRVVAARRLGLAAVAGAAGRADHVQQRLVGRERRQVGEHPAVAPAVDRRVDDAVGRQAVVAGEDGFRADRGHDVRERQLLAVTSSRSASASGRPASRISACVASMSYGTRRKCALPRLEVDQQVRGARVAVARLADRARVEQPAPLVELDLAAALREPARERVAVREPERDRDVAVADEHELGGRQLERRRARPTR